MRPSYSTLAFPCLKGQVSPALQGSSRICAFHESEILVTSNQEQRKSSLGIE